MPGTLPLDLMCVCVHAGFLLLPASEGSFVSQLRSREVSLPFPKAHPSTDRQPPKDSISCACSYLVPGLRMGKRLLPVEFPAEHAVVQPAQGGESCHMPHPEINLEWHQGPSPTFSISSPSTTLRSEGISGMQAFPLQSDRVTIPDRRYLWS